MAAPIGFDQLELSKENVQPIRGGRKPEEILRVIQAEHNLEAEINAKAKEYETLIATPSEDPLTPFLQYISWIEQVQVSGDKKHRLLKLLERCARQFENDSRYITDARFVEVWFKYASKSQEPNDIYHWMYNKGIGISSPMLYVYWALWCKEKGQLKNALKILENGKKKVKNPPELLALFKELEKQSLEKKEKEVDPTSENRTALGTISGSRRPPGASQARPSSQSQSKPQPRAAAPNQPNSFQVYVEAEFAKPGSGSSGARESTRESSSSSKKLASIVPEAATNNVQLTGKLASESTRHKENTSLPGKWTELTHQSSVSAMAISAKNTKVFAENTDFQVFVDEEFKPKQTVAEPVIPARIHAEGSRPNAKAQENPPSAFKPSFVESKPQPQVTAKPVPRQPFFSKNQTANLGERSNKPRKAEGKLETTAYDRQYAWTEAGEELSFEEIRAMLLYGYVDPDVPLPPRVREGSCDPAAYATIPMVFEEDQPLPSKKEQISSFEQAVAQKSAESLPSAQSQQTRSKPQTQSFTVFDENQSQPKPAKPSQSFEIFEDAQPAQKQQPVARKPSPPTFIAFEDTPTQFNKVRPTNNQQRMTQPSFTVFDDPVPQPTKPAAASREAPKQSNKVAFSVFEDENSAQSENPPKRTKFDPENSQQARRQAPSSQAPKALFTAFDDSAPEPIKPAAQPNQSIAFTVYDDENPSSRRAPATTNLSQAPKQSSVAFTVFDDENDARPPTRAAQQSSKPNLNQAPKPSAVAFTVFDDENAAQAPRAQPTRQAPKPANTAFTIFEDENNSENSRPAAQPAKRNPFQERPRPMEAPIVHQPVVPTPQARAAFLQKAESFVFGKDEFINDTNLTSQFTLSGNLTLNSREALEGYLSVLNRPGDDTNATGNIKLQHLQAGLSREQSLNLTMNSKEALADFLSILNNAHGDDQEEEEFEDTGALPFSAIPQHPQQQQSFVIDDFEDDFQVYEEPPKAFAQQPKKNLFEVHEDENMFSMPPQQQRAQGGFGGRAAAPAMMLPQQTSNFEILEDEPSFGSIKKKLFDVYEDDNETDGDKENGAPASFMKKPRVGCAATPKGRSGIPFQPIVDGSEAFDPMGANPDDLTDPEKFFLVSMDDDGGVVDFDITRAPPDDDFDVFEDI